MRSLRLHRQRAQGRPHRSGGIAIVAALGGAEQTVTEFRPGDTTMMTVWVLLVFWNPPGGGPVIDLSAITTGKQAYRTNDECQQARAEIIETMIADHRTGLSRCDELTIERTRPFRP